MKVCLLYLGCRVNQAEILEMESELRRRGHGLVGLDNSPDICIINTCTVTKKSDYQSRNLIRRAVRTGARVIVTGCYSELSPNEAASIEGVEAIVLNSNKHYIINKFIDNSSDTASGNCLNITQNKAEPGSDSVMMPECTLNQENQGFVSKVKRSKYFLKIQDGCNYFCSYCRVWQARGKSRSIRPSEAVAMAQKAEAEGYREIVLTGVHLGTYGKDIAEDNNGISWLLREFLLKTKNCRFRLSSLEVNEIDDSLIELFGDKRVCSHLHVPLQSGDSSVLRDMKRGYTAEMYSSRIKIISKKIKGLGLGTDVIAGFPTETNEAFQNTLALIEDSAFTYLHVFPYSARPGTGAAEMIDLVGENIRRKRATRLRSISERRRLEFAKSQEGHQLDTLIESYGEEYFRGTTGNYMKVNITKDIVNYSNVQPDIRGQMAQVKIMGINNGEIQGKLIRSM